MKSALTMPKSILIAVLMVLGTSQTVMPHPDTARPANSIRAEHKLLLKSLNDFEKFMDITARRARDPGRASEFHDTSSVLSTAMKRNGLFWRDPEKVRPRGRWWLASLVNPSARAAALNLETRAFIAEAIERAIAKDAAFKSGSRQGQLSVGTRKRLHFYLKMGRRVAGNFEIYYPPPRAQARD